jgi:hypothetical protein
MEQHLDEQSLASRLRLSVRTLQRWRWQGKGPTYLKLGGRVVYRRLDVEAWEEANRKPQQPEASEPPR